MKNIVLIGIMGCGKTTLSRMLGEKLNRPVIDTRWTRVITNYAMIIS